MNEPNPYQSPVSLDRPPEQDGYYTSKLSALRYAELWRTVDRWDHFVFAAIAKTLRLPLVSSFTFKAIEPLRLLDERELPDAAREKLLRVVQTCSELHLEFAFYCTGEFHGPTEAYAVHFLNQTGTTGLGTNWVRVRVRHVVKETLTSFAVTWLDDGTVLTTSNQRQRLDAPAIFQRMHLPGASVADLLRIHAERLQAIPSSRILPLDRDRLLERMNANKRIIASFHIRRGVWNSTPAA